ncbi:hypothetical protein ABTJ53_18925, partial [Acinetobacter baumannii]
LAPSVADAGGIARPDAWKGQRVLRDRGVLQQDGHGDIRGSLRGAGLRRSTGRRKLSLAAAA